MDAATEAEWAAARQWYLSINEEPSILSAAHLEQKITNISEDRIRDAAGNLARLTALESLETSMTSVLVSSIASKR
jgi:hypothetical protein